MYLEIYLEDSDKYSSVTVYESLSFRIYRICFILEKRKTEEKEK